MIRALLGFIVTAAVSVVLAVAMLSITFSLLLTPWPTKVFAQMFADEGPSGYTHAQMVDVAEGILDYSLGNDDADIPRGTDSVTTLTENELSHLRDCRGLFLGVIHLAIVSGVIGLAVVIFLRVLGRKRILGRAFRAAAIIVLALIVVCVFFALKDFNAFFNYLHHFFFTGESWIFPWNCLMICALPTKFWVAMGVLWVVLLGIFLGLYFRIARGLLR